MCPPVLRDYNGAMPYQCFEPESDAVRADVGLLLFNQVGGAVTQDTGRDAQALANEFGLNVIAADRPGSGMWLPRPGLGNDLRRDYIGAMAALGGRLSKEATRRGLTDLIAAGRSAGALGALTIPRTEQLPITHVYAAEPPGWYSLSVLEGAKRYRDYLNTQARMINASDLLPDIVRPDPSDVHGWTKISRFASMVPLFLTERHHTKHVCASDISRRSAIWIARHAVAIDTTVAFATHSLVTPPGMDTQAEAGYFACLRADGAPFTVRRTEEQTVHASFDKRSYMAAQLRPIVERALSKKS